MRSSQTRLIFHLAKRAAWEDSLHHGFYAPASLETEGFIHCSTREQVAETANRWYRGNKDLVLLAIDPLRLSSELRYEPPANPADERRSQIFPHVYGPLNLDAIAEATDFPCGADGLFRISEAAEA